jgi:hypothetical protein
MYFYLPYMLRVLTKRMRLLKEGRLTYYDNEVITPVSSRRALHELKSKQ